MVWPGACEGQALQPVRSCSESIEPTRSKTVRLKHTVALVIRLYVYQLFLDVVHAQILSLRGTNVSCVMTLLWPTKNAKNLYKSMLRA